MAMLIVAKSMRKERMCFFMGLVVFIGDKYSAFFERRAIFFGKMAVFCKNVVILRAEKQAESRSAKQISRVNCFLVLVLNRTHSLRLCRVR